MVALSIPLTQVALGVVVKSGTQVLKTAPFPIQKPSENVSRTVYQHWFQISSLVRFAVSGSIGTLCFFAMERIIYRQLCQMSNLPSLVESYTETVSFFVGYLLQIVTQHLLHAVLVYGLDTINTRSKYFQTLLYQFYAYGISLVGSTGLNLVLIRSGVEKTTAFLSTMSLFACVNYFVIGWLVRRATSPSEPLGKAEAEWVRDDPIFQQVESEQSWRDDMSLRAGAFLRARGRSTSLHSMLSTAMPVNVDEVNSRYR